MPSVKIIKNIKKDREFRVLCPFPHVSLFKLVCHIFYVHRQVMINLLSIITIIPKQQKKDAKGSFS